MKQLYILKLFCMCFFCGVFHFLHAQEVISSGGSTYTGIPATMDFTIGEPVIVTLENSATTLTQGFHQPFLQVVAISEPIITPKFTIYPNPATYQLTIESDAFNAGDVALLYTLQGQLLLKIQLVAGINSVDFSDYASAEYLLKINSAKNNSSQSHKIVKVN